jgi:hypothetical protein
MYTYTEAVYGTSLTYTISMFLFKLKVKLNKQVSSWHFDLISYASLLFNSQSLMIFFEELNVKLYYSHKK